MSNPRLEDHLVGLELQLVELVENKQRAEVQSRSDDARSIDKEIAAIQQELAAAAEQLSRDEQAVAPKPRLHAPRAA